MSPSIPLPPLQALSCMNARGRGIEGEMKDHLLIRAGRKALTRLREGGLDREAVDVVAGAAGGPKWLVLNGLDRAVFSSWLTSSAHPVFLVGSSIGAWRFAAIAQGMESGAYDRFEHAYLEQHYTPFPPAAEVTEGSIRVLDAFMDKSGGKAALGLAFFRLSMLAVRCTGLFSKDQRLTLGPAMILAWLVNSLSRPALKHFFSRTLFYDPRDLPPFHGMDAFPIQKVPLTAGNVKDALLASGSIPLVMEGVKDPAGASQGTYRDGGIIDYHLDIPFNSRGIVLFLHYTDRITPGWLDKMLSWRRPSSVNMEDVVMVCPSKAFVESLPYAKIPDRNDFISFRSRDRDRVAYWGQVVTKSRILGEEFMELVSGRGIMDRVQPLGALNGNG